MLRVDLRRLEKRQRLRIDEALAPDDPRWEDAGLRPAEPLVAGLEVTQTGRDVLVRGRIRGVMVSECRRCLREVRLPVAESVTLLYRAGIDRAEAEREEAYPLPEREGELDLWPAIREHVMLAAPKYPVCRPECKGMCGRCGADRNEGPCGCGTSEPDERWSALRGLKLEP
jgi:uncharacterized protein